MTSTFLIHFSQATNILMFICYFVRQANTKGKLHILLKSILLAFQSFLICFQCGLWSKLLPLSSSQPILLLIWISAHDWLKLRRSKTIVQSDSQTWKFSSRTTKQVKLLATAILVFMVEQSRSSSQSSLSLISTSASMVSHNFVTFYCLNFNCSFRWQSNWESFGLSKPC